MSIEKVVKILFAKSNNQCAFPECKSKIITVDNSIIGDICHIKAKNKKGKRYDKNQSKEERESYDNLILLCKNHHKEIDDNPKKYTVAVLKEYKSQHEDNSITEVSMEDARKAMLLLQNNNVISVGDSSNVINNSPSATLNSVVNLKIQGIKVLKINQPAGTIGSDLSKKAYVKYLIDQYGKFSKGANTEYNFAIIYKNIKDKFGIKWDLISIKRFDNVAEYLCMRINRTELARKTKYKPHTFEEHIRIMEGKK
jgi:hypothetical protein